MESDIEIFVYTETDDEARTIKVSPEATVVELLEIVSPGRSEELCLILSGEEAPKENGHQLKDCGIHHGHHAHCHPRHKKERPRHERCVEVIVNGKPVEVKYVPQELGRLLVERALEESRNSGQSPDNWQLRNEEGAMLDQAKQVREYKLTEHSKLFLNLQAGGGGTNA